jgi:cobalt-zinc-cadmium efflux system membrane fusion protein
MKYELKMSRRFWLSGVAAMAMSGMTACSEKKSGKDEHGHEEGAEEEVAKGPHGGRLLEDGEFSLEVTIFEDGVEPVFKFYPYQKKKPLDPKSVEVDVVLTRLGGKVDRFKLAPHDDHLMGDATVREPHSFDVAITAKHAGKVSNWKYASYEGRTTIAPEAAVTGGIQSEAAGPAILAERIDMSGRVEITPEGKSEVRAWYPGRVVSMNGELGQAVRKGQILARVESSESLQTYSIPAPISGVIMEKNANVGGVAYDSPLYVLADPTSLHAEFFVFPRDAEKIRVGQDVEVRTLGGEVKLLAKVESLLPNADPTTQTLMAHVHLPPGASANFHSGLGVEGSFIVGSEGVPLAVRTNAIQRFRDFQVVFAKIGNTYEVRMLKLGRQTPEWTEVLEGLDPGEVYVTQGAFLIRADIEKSGASHDH